MTEPARQPGVREVALVALAVVAVVAAAALLTGVLPDPLRAAVLDGPVLIGVLVIGTAWLLWRIARGRPLDGPG